MSGSYDSISSIQDAAAFVQHVLTEDARYVPRHVVAGWIIGMNAVPETLEWQNACLEYALVDDLAANAELGEASAEAVWDDLLEASARFSAAVGLPAIPGEHDRGTRAYRG